MLSVSLSSNLEIETFDKVSAELIFSFVPKLFTLFFKFFKVESYTSIPF